MCRWLWARAVFALALTALAGGAQARVTGIEILGKESPTFEGASFGAAGAYEKLTGKIFGEVDPRDPRNALIVDLGNAPKNARGMVEYESDFLILKPIDPAKGNRRLWFEINNRGSLAAFAQLNEAYTGGNDPSFAADAGNGFLMRQGFTVLSLGWDASASPGAKRLLLRVPVAKSPDGSSIVGPSLEEFVIDDARTRIGFLSYPAASRDKSQARLSMRARADDPPINLPPSDWDFADPAGIAIRLSGGEAFRQGMLYEFAYQARNPLVMGLGLAALRDGAEFFRAAAKDDAGRANPLAGSVDLVYSACYSQPCRAMHDFLRLGFNQTESGKRAFDGVINFAAGAGGIFLNYRFAQPGRTQRQHVGRHYPEFEQPFTNQVILDPITGERDGRLRRCLDSDSCPRIFEINTANEYWAKDMALGQIDGALRDLPDAPGVRDYFLASLPHSPASGPGICQQERNPLGPETVLRALLLAMDEWVSKGREPPASRMPRLADGTLVPPLPRPAQGFPAISGVAYNGRMHGGERLDFGPLFGEGILSLLPPRRLAPSLPALVPKSDADGNDIAGIRLPEIAAPLASHTGWALRGFPKGIDEGCDGFGQMIPFAKSKAERERTGDPRLSLEERYPTRQDYLSRIAQAVRALLSERFLLEEDAVLYRANADRLPLPR